MDDTVKKKRIRSIWSLIGYIFIIYGVLLMGAGVYYLFYPRLDLVLNELNPSLWWGGILFVIGFIFSFVDTKRRG